MIEIYKNAAKSLDNLKLLALLGHFSFQQQHLQRLALLEVGRSGVGSEDEEVAVLLLHRLYAQVELVELVQGVEEEADAQ